MKQKKQKCKYCSSPMESKTTRKEFCSSKCRVYWNREAGEHNVPAATTVTGKEDKGIAGPPQPPPGLKGIDLAIWKAEQKGKV